MPTGPSAFDIFKDLIANGRYADAEALASQTVKAAPGDPFWHFLLAHSLRMQGRLSEAEAELHTALTRRPAYPEALNELGQVLAARGSHAEARQAYERAIDLRPDFFEPHYNLGIVLAAAADVNEAIERTRQAIAIDPKRPEAHETLARWQFQTGDLDAAERACREALALAPAWAMLHYHVGAIHAQRRDYDTSEDWMRQAVELEPQNPEWRVGLRTTRALADHVQLARRRWTRQTLTMPELRLAKPVRFNRRDVPVALVRDHDEFFRIAAALRRSTNRHDPVVFRGQSRDWFAEEGQLSLEPARFRRSWQDAQLSADIEAWRQALRSHLGALTEPGRPVYQLGNVDIAPPPVGVSGFMVDVGLANPELAGTMQHYGFPTDFLDVTSDPEIALWFALHTTTTTVEGTVRFDRHPWTAATAIESWPTVYALVPFRGQLVDLTDGCLTQASSLRVQRQRACLVSYMILHEPILSPISRVAGVRDLPPTIEEMHPDLVLVLKFEPNAAWQALRQPSASEMFPADDPIVRTLQRARVPHLCHYAL